MPLRRWRHRGESVADDWLVGMRGGRGGGRRVCDGRDVVVAVVVREIAGEGSRGGGL